MLDLSKSSPTDCILRKPSYLYVGYPSRNMDREGRIILGRYLELNRLQPLDKDIVLCHSCQAGFFKIKRTFQRNTTVPRIATSEKARMDGIHMYLLYCKLGDIKHDTLMTGCG